jgi:phosphogluconate dehydratase
MHNRIVEVTERIRERSRDTRAQYLSRIQAAAEGGPKRMNLPCGNLAHGFAACSAEDKTALRETPQANVAIVSAYNDMLSAHQPFEAAPAIIKDAVKRVGAVAQFAGGVPAMCDGVTQGQPGMDLSLFSRDLIAMSTAVALSHDMFDAALYLGVCDKIVPGLLIGALSFGHLPALFVPAGPMVSGLPNSEKARARQLFAEGKVGREALLEAESASYHSPGTCTFYGTANSNQMLMEIMGLHLPGSSFVNPYTPLRDALTAQAAQQVVKFTAQGDDFRPIGELVDERAIVNGVIGLLATGGSTNHTIHLIAIAKAAGIVLTWDDFSSLSDVVPLLTRIYPNGNADINHFHAAGGMGYLMATLMDSGLLHADVVGVADKRGLENYRVEPVLDNSELNWRPIAKESLDTDVLRPVEDAFSQDGGLKTLTGNLGRGVIKVSAVKASHRFVEAPAVVFDSQIELNTAFQAGELQRDMVAVVRYQGPKSNGMPELHKLMTPLAVLQDKGFKVALVTDGRLSGASGKVPAAIHLTPECADGGPLAKVRSGDMIRLDAEAGTVEVLISDEELQSRIPAAVKTHTEASGMGRELFSIFRQTASSAETGASCVMSLGE